MNREPLTLEQLRELRENSEFVGANVLLEIHGVTCCGVLDYRFDDGICASYYATKEWLKEKDYGETWLAYAYPPASIDREAWEPCEACEPQLLFMGNNYCGNCGRPLTPEAWAELEKRMGV